MARPVLRTYMSVTVREMWICRYMRLTPDMQIVGRRRIVMRRLRIVQQIAVNVVFHDEARGIEPSPPESALAQMTARATSSPIVKDLATHDVPSDAPAVLVPLVAQPVVS